MKVTTVLIKEILAQIWRLNYISILVPNILLIRQDKPSLIKDLAIKLKFERVSLREVVKIAWVIARDRVSVVISVRAILTLTLVQRWVRYIDLAHFIDLYSTLEVVIPLWAEAGLGHNQLLSTSELVAMVCF
jgi:hypothetical protein